METKKPLTKKALKEKFEFMSRFTDAHRVMCKEGTIGWVQRQHKWENYDCCDEKGSFLFTSSTKDKWEAAEELWQHLFAKQ